MDIFERILKSSQLYDDNNLKNLIDSGQVTTASNINRPEPKQSVKEIDLFNAFMKRNPKANGGTIAGGNIQGQEIGNRTGFAKPKFLPTKNEYVVKGRDNNVVKRFKVSDYKNKQEAKKETFKFYKNFLAENREKAKTQSIENRAKFNKARTDYKLSINRWVQNWMDNNVDNYTLRQSDKFIKDLKKDFKKDFNLVSPAKNVKSTIVDNYPNIGTAAKTGKAAFKPYGIEPILRTGGEAGVGKKVEAPYESFFKRAFFTKKINDNPVLKNRISKYLDYYTLKKPGGGVALDKIKAQYADTLNNLDDVMYVLSDDTGVANVAKNNLFKNIFPQYQEFRKKQNASKISRDANIAKIEKTLGPKKLKQILNGGTSIDKFLVDEGKALKKIFNVEGLDKSLRYSIDHNLGISNIAKMSKPDMEIALQSLVGTTVERNNRLGWGGYTLRSQKLIRDINEGKNVAKNLDELNKITQDAYGPELKGKDAYTISNDKLRFTEDFNFRSNPEERFKSYFREIYQTPQGKKEILKQAGSLKNILASLENPDLIRLARIGCAGKATGGRIGYFEGQNLTYCATKGAEKIKNDPLNLTPGDQQNLRALGKSAKAAKFLKGFLGPAAIAGELIFEGGFAANKFMDKGVPIKQALGESYINKYLLGPKLQIDVEAEREKEMAKGEEFAMAERGRRMAPFMAQSKEADERRLKQRQAEMNEMYPNMIYANPTNEVIDRMLEEKGVYSPYTLGFGMQQRQPGIGDMRYNEQLAYDQLRDFINSRVDEAMQENKMSNLAYGAANFSNGGIAGLSGGVKSGPAPESGKTPHGLLSIKNNVKKY